MKILQSNERPGDYLIFCPGCGFMHCFSTITPNGNNAKWTFNGDLNKPTFSPSLLVNKGTKWQCHSFVRKGKIEFLRDCFHKYAGTTVELPDVGGDDL